MVDTGVLAANAASVIGTEALWINGPFSLQGEWAFATALDTTGTLGTTNGTPTGTAPVIRFPSQNLNFNGGYLLASYFLTGENRGYDNRLGRLASNYIAGGPRTPFWFVRGENGGLDRGIGAWELAARVSYLNLNDGPVEGGVMVGATAGINWYLTNNVKIQFEYQYDRRESLPPGTIPGDVQGFATRVQLSF